MCCQAGQHAHRPARARARRRLDRRRHRRRTPLKPKVRPTASTSSPGLRRGRQPGPTGAADPPRDRAGSRRATSPPSRSTSLSATQDPQNYAALRSPSAHERRGRRSPSRRRRPGGAASATVALAALAARGYARRLPVEIGSIPAAGGHTWIVRVDGGASARHRPRAGRRGPVRFAAETPTDLNGGYLARVEDVVVPCPQRTRRRSSAPVSRAGTAASCVRAAYAVFRVQRLRPRPRPPVRDRLRQGHPPAGAAGDAVWRASRRLRRARPLVDHRRAVSPRQMQDVGFNTEHVWPRSRAPRPAPPPTARRTTTSTTSPRLWGRSTRPAATARSGTTSPRTTRRSGIEARPRATTRPGRRATPRRGAASSATSRATPTTAMAGRAWTSSAASTPATRRAATSARQAAYFLATYRIEAEDGGAGTGSGEGRAFIDATLDVLLRTGTSGPRGRLRASSGTSASTASRATATRSCSTRRCSTGRSTRGRTSPARATSGSTRSTTRTHGADTGEGVEIAGRAGTDLYGYRVWALLRLRHHATPWTATAADDSPASRLPGNIDDEGGGLGAVWQGAEAAPRRLPGARAHRPRRRVLQFLSYGGCRFNALSGPVFDAAEAPARARRRRRTPTRSPGARPSAGGASRTAPTAASSSGASCPPGTRSSSPARAAPTSDFTWAGPAPRTPAAASTTGRRPSAPFVSRQAGAANSVSGWADGDDVPLGMLAPAQRHRPRRGRAPLRTVGRRLGGSGHPSRWTDPAAARLRRAGGLAPAPNPARTSSRCASRRPSAHRRGHGLRRARPRGRAGTIDAAPRRPCSTCPALPRRLRRPRYRRGGGRGAASTQAVTRRLTVAR